MLPLEVEDFFYPAGRSERYIILKISMIEGSSVETKKQLIYLLFERINKTFGISMTDIEINILEVPKHNWGFLGKMGDEVEPNTKIDVQRSSLL